MLDHITSTVTSADLDHPIEASFRDQWRPFAEAWGQARILPSNIGHFAAPGPSGLAEEGFHRLVSSRSDPVILLQVPSIEVPNSLRVLHAKRGVQMVHVAQGPSRSSIAVRDLGWRDYADMLALARLTQPGPFEINTGALGQFIGIRQNGRLIAMAGQRMAFGDLVEISGVCVHPSARGQGHAKALMSSMIERIRASHRRPFLHTYSENTGAITLYRQLGFEIRTDVNITVLENTRS